MHVLLIDTQLVDRGALPLARTSDAVLPEIHALAKARALFALTMLGAVAALDNYARGSILGEWRAGTADNAHRLCRGVEHGADGLALLSPF